MNTMASTRKDPYLKWISVSAQFKGLIMVPWNPEAEHSRVENLKANSVEGKIVRTDDGSKNW